MLMISTDTTASSNKHTKEAPEISPTIQKIRKDYETSTSHLRQASRRARMERGRTSQKPLYLLLEVPWNKPSRRHIQRAGDLAPSWTQHQAPAAILARLASLGNVQGYLDKHQSKSFTKGPWSVSALTDPGLYFGEEGFESFLDE